MSKPEHHIVLGVVGAAHGIKGEVRVKTFTADPLALAEYGKLKTRDGRSFEIVDIRTQGNVVVVRFKDVGDRNAAEALNGVELLVERSALPANLGEEEFYHADLVGLDVRDDMAATIGRVTAVHNYGGGDILEIALDRGGQALVPFTRAAVPEVTVSARYLRVDPVAAGLVDVEDDDGEPGASRRGDGGFDRERRPRGPKGAGGNR